MKEENFVKIVWIVCLTFFIYVVLIGQPAKSQQHQDDMDGILMGYNLYENNFIPINPTYSQGQGFNNNNQYVTYTAKPKCGNIYEITTKDLNGNQQKSVGYRSQINNSFYGVDKNNE